MENQLTFLLLAAFAVGLVVTALLCALFLLFFPWFRSGERKIGHFKADQSSGGVHRIDTIKREGRPDKLRVRSSELPLVGGPALLLGITAGCVGLGFWVGLSENQWILMGILLFAMLGLGLVGFFDDARKVNKGSGISELQKFVGVLVVSLLTAIAFNRLIVDTKMTEGLTARLAYSPYKDLPVLGHILVDVHFAWIVFFLLMTMTVTSSTALAVDFTDGMDGLAGGLLLSAALAFAAILIALNNAALLPAALAMLAMAGATLGYLPFNWPSAWRGGSGAKRRARLIMGDTGSLALGGLLALVAVISRLEFLLIIIGGVFLLEGLSALISARILVRFFRLALFHERFRAKRGFAHTEFPLPFLATPMHHHYDLLGWNRKKLVYTAWLVGAFLGVLGVASVSGAYTWERYLARFVGFLVLFGLWRVGTATRSFFIGLAPAGAASIPDQTETPRRLALYYGMPYKLFRWPLYAARYVTQVTEAELAAPAEQMILWQRMSVFDARSLLGYYCYRADHMRDAAHIWGFIPKPNLDVRPEISEMLVEARNRLAMESEVDLGPASHDPNTAPRLNSGHAHEPAIGWSRRGEMNGRDAGQEPQPDPLPQEEAPLWSASAWTAATTAADPNAEHPATQPPSPQPSVVPVVTRQQSADFGWQEHHPSTDEPTNGKNGVN